MSDKLKPWLEELDAQSPLRELLESARADEPTAAQLAGLESKLAHLFQGPGGGGDRGGQHGEGQQGSGVTSTGGTSGASMLGATKTLVVAAVTSAVVGTGAFQAGRIFEKGRTEATITMPAPKMEVKPAPPLTVAPTPTVVEAKAPPPASPQERVRGVSFEEETALLGKALEALQQENYTQAQRHIRRHEKTFPEGLLIQERELLAVQTLMGLGETELARARVEKFRQKWPTSPHVRRLEGFLQAR